MSHCRGVATSHTDITDVAQRSSRRPLSAALCGWSDPWPKLRWLAHAHKAPPQPPHRGVLLVDTTTCLLFIKKVVSEETKGRNTPTQQKILFLISSSMH
ncbi:hypothetical protein J6590_028261 [Homalodisca vitripennis]|nr:hypothetical protein J6590_028261 [Homalodisca vitripennis]